jgi:hypothetical protein
MVALPYDYLENLEFVMMLSAEACKKRWGIVGGRGQIRLGRSHWAVPYYLDIGAGSSEFTWEGMAGIASGFSRGGVQPVYRHLYFDQKSGKLLQSVRFSGPALGVTFCF